MGDFKEKLIEVIAAKVIEHGHMSDLPLPKGFGTLRWTGWKESWAQEFPHGQIIWFIEREPGQNRKIAYVDIPSMQHGIIEQGATFSIERTDKSHYFTYETTQDELREWFKEAFTLLMDDILEACPWLMTNPVEKK